MLNLTYNKSEEINANIAEIESLRTKILLTPIKPFAEAKLIWEASINKAYWSLTLANNPLTRNQVVRILNSPLPKRLTNEQKEVIDYIKTIKHIRERWTGDNTQLTTSDVLKLYDMSCKSVFGSSTAYFKSKESSVDNILNFIEKGNDHPVIQAGLAQIEIIKLSPFENCTGRVARLLSQLILTKYGYDMRGMLVLDDYYREDLVALKEATESVKKSQNATFWLVYFTNGLKKSLQKTLDLIEDQKNSRSNTSTWKLNHRQKQILDTTLDPNRKITNRDLQNKFNVSQITASRDLSKMVNLGLLLPHGKGRSVFYTKA